MRDKLGRFVKGFKHTEKFKIKMRKRMKGNQWGFRKDHLPWNKNKKCPWVKDNPQIFKEGHIPWNTDKKCPQLSRENHGRFKIGGIKHNGYVFILQPSHPRINSQGYVRKSHLIVQKHLKRFLTKKEIVHHRNSIKDDDRPENLMAFTSESAHQRFHHNPDNVKSSEIIFDGRKLKRR